MENTWRPSAAVLDKGIYPRHRAGFGCWREVASGSEMASRRALT